MFISTASNLYTSVTTYGATGNGTTDDTAAIKAAISAVGSAGGVVYLPPGTYKLLSPLTLGANVQLLGSGNASVLVAGSGFSGAQMILCNGNFAGVADLQINGGPSTTYSSNPALNAIQVTGAVGVVIQNVFAQYVNGWGIQSTATSGQANFNLFCVNVHIYSSAQGIHTLGVSGSNNSGVQHIIGCNMDLIQNGDCYLVEDINDILFTNILGSCTAGSGNSLHIKGKCNAIFAENVDLGPYPGPSTGAVVLIESDGNGAPNLITIKGGIVEGGTTNISITAGTNINLSALKIYNAGTFGCNFTAGDQIVIDDCVFSGNGSSGTTGRYDFQSSTTGHVLLNDCYFTTPQGSGAGQTNNAINNPGGAGTHVISGCAFYGTGYNSGNIFNNYPAIIRNCPGLNPLGSVTPPTIGASPYTTSPQSFDYTVHVSGGTVSSIAIGGTSTGLTSGTFRVPARQTITLTYSVAPSWTWFGD